VANMLILHNVEALSRVVGKWQRRGSQ